MANGSPRGFFSCSRGHRRGGSLVSLLFVIVMEALSKMIDKAIGGVFLTGFSV